MDGPKRCRMTHWKAPCWATAFLKATRCRARLPMSSSARSPMPASQQDLRITYEHSCRIYTLGMNTHCRLLHPSAKLPHSLLTTVAAERVQIHFELTMSCACCPAHLLSHAVAIVCVGCLPHLQTATLVTNFTCFTAYAQAPDTRPMS